jgi:GNAT superfamily N-acetyltransferase
VTVDERDRPVAYLLSTVIDDCLHVVQVTVSPSHARRRLGAALIEHLGALALAEGRPALTLTTFRDVPWNAPYYERLGFVVVEPAGQGPELAALVAQEVAAIPGDAPRVAMRRPLAPG